MNEKIKALAKAYIKAKSNLVDAYYKAQARPEWWQMSRGQRNAATSDEAEKSLKAQRALENAILADESITLGWKDGDTCYIAQAFNATDNKIKVVSFSITMIVHVIDENDIRLVVRDYTSSVELPGNLTTSDIFRSAYDAEQAMWAAMLKAMKATKEGVS